MDIKAKLNRKIITKDHKGQATGFLVPIYNIHDGFFEEGKEPQQVYLTVIEPRQIKGRTFISFDQLFYMHQGNARFILKTKEGYRVYSGDSHEYCSVIVPTGVPAALQNLGDDEAYVLICLIQHGLQRWMMSTARILVISISIHERELRLSVVTGGLARSPKILLLGDFSWPMYQEACAFSLEELGCEVTRFGWLDDFRVTKDGVTVPCLSFIVHLLQYRLRWVRFIGGYGGV